MGCVFLVWFLSLLTLSSFSVSSPYTRGSIRFYMTLLYYIPFPFPFCKFVVLAYPTFVQQCRAVHARYACVFGKCGSRLN
ncbi:hypothetical protein QBC46DRAFT_155336 [Diplogelasinospora grovesii]|uniref:Secreted peptide n=1 Tax=Diplogelasinospora grovesii TaxID=303347 RepID=A0AAN6N5K5_9PEZI|nr:hypothetical protein QBC46DRAFT_155336 [Diplogelasinospora grovesii]